MASDHIYAFTPSSQRLHPLCAENELYLEWPIGTREDTRRRRTDGQLARRRFSLVAARQSWCWHPITEQALHSKTARLPRLQWPSSTPPVVVRAMAPGHITRSCPRAGTPNNYGPTSFARTLRPARRGGPSRPTPWSPRPHGQTAAWHRAGPARMDTAAAMSSVASRARLARLAGNPFRPHCAKDLVIVPKLAHAERTVSPAAIVLVRVTLMTAPARPPPPLPAQPGGHTAPTSAGVRTLALSVRSGACLRWKFACVKPGCPPCGGRMEKLRQQAYFPGVQTLIQDRLVSAASRQVPPRGTCWRDRAG